MDHQEYVDLPTQLAEAYGNARQFGGAEETIAKAQMLAARCNCCEREQLALRKDAYTACKLEAVGKTDRAVELFD